ncbi:MAG: hypothetical protein K5655_04455 [Lachnospiraceae bacterium]|nr:hypothetical protein [Lachnospiraceae bacterium]
MSYSIKRNKGVTAKFKSLSVDEAKHFIDLETGEIIDLATIVSKTIGAGEPFSAQLSTKDEEDITPTSED